MLHKSLWIQNVQRYMYELTMKRKNCNKSQPQLEIHPSIGCDWFLWRTEWVWLQKASLLIEKASLAGYPVPNLNCPILTRSQCSIHHASTLFFCRCMCHSPLSHRPVPGAVRKQEPSMSMLPVLHKWNISTHHSPTTQTRGTFCNVIWMQCTCSLVFQSQCPPFFCDVLLPSHPTITAGKMQLLAHWARSLRWSVARSMKTWRMLSTS